MTALSPIDKAAPGPSRAGMPAGAGLTAAVVDLRRCIVFCRRTFPATILKQVSFQMNAFGGYRSDLLITYGNLDFSAELTCRDVTAKGQRIANERNRLETAASATDDDGAITQQAPPQRLGYAHRLHP